MTLLFLLACAAAPAGPGELWTSPDADRDGLLGQDGPLGAAWTSYDTLARATDIIRATVFFPSDADGWPVAEALPAPTALFVHGGSVDPTRYRWLAAHLATRGYAVVLAEHSRDLAFFQPDNSLYAWERLGVLAGEPGTLEGLIDPEAEVVVAGHSLGAVVAAGLWAGDDRLRGLVMLAGYPASSVDVGARAGSPALELAGATDGLADLDTIVANTEGFEDPFLFGVVEGLNHFAWTDDNSARDVAKDGPLEGDLDTLRANALGLMDPWMDAVLLGDVDAATLLAAGSFDGVELR